MTEQRMAEIADTADDLAMLLASPYETDSEPDPLSITTAEMLANRATVVA